jgi:hypothetical protein
MGFTNITHKKSLQKEAKAEQLGDRGRRIRHQQTILLLFLSAAVLTAIQIYYSTRQIVNENTQLKEMPPINKVSHDLDDHLDDAKVTATPDEKSVERAADMDEAESGAIINPTVRNPHADIDSYPRPKAEDIPETLETIEFCAEKCRYIREMCTDGLHREKLSLPAPTCLNYSLTVADDIYWTDYNTKEQILCKKRNSETSNLTVWAAARARRSRRPKKNDTSLACEDVPTNYTAPMMFPEEFEFIVKLMANARPQTYLEWGCGASTSFYPLLASGDVYAIDGYPPWCKQVSEEPRVQCMVKEGRLKFVCPPLLGGNGSQVQMGGLGMIPITTPEKDVLSAMQIYVEAIDTLGVTTLDVALVDGRFRLQCAIKLLPYLKPDSVLLMHDFFLRSKYHAVLEYYDVIGYARSVVALKKKEGLSEEVERDLYKRFMGIENGK